MVNEEVTMTMSVLPGAMTGISTLMAGMVSINNIFMDMTRQIDSTFGLVDATVITTGTVIAQFGLKAAEAFGQFEQGMKVVQMVSGETKQNIEALSQTANQFSVQYRMDIDQITDGLQTLGRAGLNSATEQAEVLQNGLYTAKLEGRNLNDVLEELIQTTALLGGNLKSTNFGEQTGYVEDLMVATSMTAPITTHDVNETLKYSGGIAAAAGANIETEEGKRILEDYMGAIAAFAQKGVTGSIAGTALRAFFNKPATQDSSVKEALSSINLKPEYLWEDDEETMKPISEQIGLIQKQMDKLNVSTMDRLQIWSKIVGGKMGQQMMKLDSSSIKELTADIRAADSAENLAIGSMQTFQSNMKEMSEQGQVAFREFGGRVAYFLNPVIDLITKILEIFSNPAVSAGLFAGFLLAIGKVYSSLKKVFSGLKSEFSQFMNYFKSGEPLMAMKPSVERGLQRKYGYSDYQAPGGGETAEERGKNYLEGIKSVHSDYLISTKNFKDSQLAILQSTSNWTKEAGTGDWNSDLMKLANGKPIFTEGAQYGLPSKISDAFIIKTLMHEGLWNDEWTEHFFSEEEGIRSKNAVMSEIGDDIYFTFQEYLNKIKEAYEKEKKIVDEMTNSHEKYINTVKEEIVNQEAAKNNLYGNSETSSIVDNAKKTNKALEDFHNQTKNQNKENETINNAKKANQARENYNNQINQEHFGVGYPYNPNRLVYRDKGDNWATQGSDYVSLEDLNLKTKFTGTEFADYHLKGIKAVKQAEEEVKKVDNAAEQYATNFKNELARFELALRKPFLEREHLFNDFYEKNQDKKLQQMGIPITKMDKALLPAELIQGDFVQGLVPNITKEQFLGLRASGGGTVADALQGMGNKKINKIYNNFIDLLERRLNSYLDFIAPPVPKINEESFSYLTARTQLSAPAGKGQGEWSFNRIANQLRDMYKIDSFRQGEIPLYRGDWGKNPNLNKKEIADFAYPYLADWSITKRDDPIKGISDAELKEMAINLGVNPKDWKGNRDKKIQLINDHLKNGRVDPRYKAWLDDYNELADNFIPETSEEYVVPLLKIPENRKGGSHHIPKIPEEPENPFIEPIVQEDIIPELIDDTNESNTSLNKLKENIKKRATELSDFTEEIKANEEKRQKLEDEIANEGKKTAERLGVKKDPETLEETRKRLHKELEEQNEEKILREKISNNQREINHWYSQSNEALREQYSKAAGPAGNYNLGSLKGASLDKQQELAYIDGHWVIRNIEPTKPTKPQTRPTPPKYDVTTGRDMSIAEEYAAWGFTYQKGIREKISEEINEVTDSVKSGVTGFFSNAKKRIGANRPGRMIGYDKATTKFQKMVNVVGNVTDLFGGPLMVAMEGFSIATAIYNHYLEKYNTRLQEATDKISEMTKAVEEAEDIFFNGKNEEGQPRIVGWSEQNPNATAEEKEDALLGAYEQIYDHSTEGLSSLDANTQQLAIATEELKQTNQYLVHDWLEDPNFGPEGRVTKVLNFLPALLAGVSNLLLTVVDATAYVDKSGEKTKYARGNDYLTSGEFYIGEDLKGENYPWSTDFAPALAANIWNKGNLKGGLQDLLGTRSYAALDDQMSSLVDRKFGNSSSRNRVGAPDPWESSAWGIHSKNIQNEFSSSKDMNNLQMALKNYSKDFSKLAKQTRRFEKATGKTALGAFQGEMRKTKNVKKALENLKVTDPRLVAYLKSLAIKTGMDEQQILMAAQLQQLQEMQTIAKDQVAPRMESLVGTAYQQVAYGGQTLGTVSGSGSGAISAAKNAAAIAALLNAQMESKLDETSYKDYKSKFADPNEAKYKTEEDFSAAAAYAHNHPTEQNKWLREYYDKKMAAYATTNAMLYNPNLSADEAAKMGQSFVDSYTKSGASSKAIYDTLRKGGIGGLTQNILSAYDASLNEEEGGNSSGSGSGSGSDSDKDNTGTKKERVDLVLCSKKEIPKLNVNLFKKPPTFTVLNKNFKVRDVKINTEDTPKAIMSSIKNAFIDVQKRSDPKIIQDEDAVYDPEGATDGNPLPSGTAKTRTSE